MVGCFVAAVCDCVNNTGGLVSVRIDHIASVEHAAFSVAHVTAESTANTKQQIRRTHHHLASPPLILAAYSVL